MAFVRNKSLTFWKFNLIGINWDCMQARAHLASAQDILPLRMRYREEMNCQIVHDSIHRRAGWTKSWLLCDDDRVVGFGLIAIAGPWKDKPTLLEFYVLPEERTQAFHLFETLLEVSGAQAMEIQSNDALLAVMFHTFARDVFSEK